MKKGLLIVSLLAVSPVIFAEECEKSTCRQQLDCEKMCEGCPENKECQDRSECRSECTKNHLEVCQHEQGPCGDDGVCTK